MQPFLWHRQRQPTLSTRLSLFVAQTASADVVNEALRDTSRVVDLDEVVVVTQPKENYRLRQQPLSSSMYSFDDMQTLGIRDLRELSSYVPSFVMPDYGSRYTSSVYVRGIGSRVNSPIIGSFAVLREPSTA